MIVGIDLGTTNSLAGLWTGDGPRLIANALGKFLTPSAVGVDEGGQILLGEAARERLISHPTTTCAAFKRYMGSEREIRLGQRLFRPEELSSLILRSLLDDVEAALGERPSEAVVSVPAYFSDAQRKATRIAGELAGVRVERIINEPTAAALAYGLQKRGEQSKFLIFDLGGGTFDVSILEMFDGVMEVHASAGDNFLGGEDFVDLLCDSALGGLKLDRSNLSATDLALLRSRMETAKCQLSSAREVETSVRCNGREEQWTITTEAFESLAGPLLQRMRAPVERALRDSRCKPDELQEIVLVGGASRMPMISRLVTRLFGRLPMRHIDPEQTIAIGAAVMSGMKSRAEAFNEIVMTDVCPYTLGVEVSTKDANGQIRAGQFSPIIERNTVIPTSRVERYYPIQDFQEKLHLKVFQGESPRTANNIFLGELLLPLPRDTAANMPVDVRFTYDVNGLLEVDAHIVAIDNRHNVVIERNPGVLPPDEIRRRFIELSNLKVHPREDQANMAVVARAERLYEENIGDARRAIGELLQLFYAELDTQDVARIERSRKAFMERLDDVDRLPLP